MERKRACRDESIEFLCPTCGASAFEVIGTQQNYGVGIPAAPSLIIECLVCLEQFHHPIQTQEPCRMRTETHEKIGAVAAPLLDGWSHPTV